MLDWIIKKMNWWGSKTKGEEYGSKLQFLNRNKEKFEWDNDELCNDSKLVEEVPMTHLTLLAEILGIVEENDFSDEDAPAHKLWLVDDAILAAQAAANANLTKTTGVLHQITRVTNGFNMPIIPDDNNDGEDEDNEYDNNIPIIISNIEDVVDDDADNNEEVEKEEEAVDVSNESENEETEESEDEDEEVSSQNASNC